jgi:lipopolysaccharide/colanic/teichoic acid biosynthesis glycosyltransferase
MSLHSVEPTLRKCSGRGTSRLPNSRGAASTTSEMRRRVEKDLEHVEKQSLALDLQILLLTLPALFCLCDAY